MVARPSHATAASEARSAALQLRGGAGPLRVQVHWPAPASDARPAGTAAAAPPTAAAAAPPVAPAVLVFFCTPEADSPADPAVEARCRELCARLGVIVLWAPVVPVPDAVTVTHWAADHGAELDADPRRLLLGGEGRGARLSLDVARLARDQGWPPIAGQVLVAPDLGPVAAAGPVVRGGGGLAAGSLAGVAPATLVPGVGRDPGDLDASATRLRQAGLEVDERSGADLAGALDRLAAALLDEGDQQVGVGRG